jgi:Thioredoxin reductase
LITPAEVVGIKGDGHVSAITVEKEGETFDVETDYFVPLFGLTPKLGDIANWGLEIEKNAIVVNNALDYQTNIPGVYAIGDVNTYPGKLKLILCGFHEATLMCQSVYNMLNPGKKYVLKYTTVSGVDGFDGSRKEAEKSSRNENRLKAASRKMEAGWYKSSLMNKISHFVRNDNIVIF